MSAPEPVVESDGFKGWSVDSICGVMSSGPEVFLRAATPTSFDGLWPAEARAIADALNAAADAAEAYA